MLYFILDLTLRMIYIFGNMRIYYIYSNITDALSHPRPETEGQRIK